jgi:hypothetical protein
MWRIYSNPNPHGSHENENLLLEPSSNFSENFSLLMAPAVIKIAKRITVPVRVMNPFNESKTVYRDTVLGTTLKRS